MSIPPVPPSSADGNAAAQAEIAQARAPQSPRAERPRPRADPPAKPATVVEPPKISLSIRMDSGGRVIYQLVDEKSGAIVRQVPHEEVLKAARAVAELLRENKNHAEKNIDIQY